MFCDTPIIHRKKTSGNVTLLTRKYNKGLPYIDTGSPYELIKKVKRDVVHLYDIKVVGKKRHSTLFSRYTYKDAKIGGSVI